MNKKYIHFGAGNIGRGLIAQLYQEIKMPIIFIDTSKELIDKINQSNSYKICCVPSNQEILITNYSALNSIDNQESVIKEISEANLISTSIGIDNLKKISNLISSALSIRTIKTPLSIACFENGYEASKNLYLEIIKVNNSNKNKCGYINVVVDRLVPNQENKNSLDVKVEDFYSVWYQKENSELDWDFKNTLLIQNYDNFFNKKFYGVNGLHLAIALIGIYYQKNFIYEVLEDKDCLNKVNEFIKEAIPAIASLTNQDESSIESYLNTNLKRFSNKSLKDELTRVARNPQVKLSTNERFMPLYQWLKNHKRKMDMFEEVLNYGKTYCASLGFKI